MTGRSRSRLKVLVYPADRNPYQQLLYEPMQAAGDVVIRQVGRRPYGLLLVAVQMLWFRIRGYRVLHVHWPAWHVLRPRRFRIQISTITVAAFLALIDLLRFRLVWTVHNIVPHRTQTRDDLQVARRLAGSACALIAHSQSTVVDMRAAGLDVSRAHVIEHGSYGSTYPAEADRERARRDLDLDDRFTIVFFGLIREYKGVDDLLDAHEDPRLADTVLLIAGRCEPGPLRDRLAAPHRNVRFRDGYVPEAEVPSYFAAADVVCLPFRRVTTSGSALLAMTMGAALVAPRLGALRDLPEDTGFFYESADPDGLRDALIRARSEPGEVARRRTAARGYAAGLDWTTSAERTVDLYRECSGRLDRDSV